MLDNFLKKFIPEEGERYIFFENGKPVFVIISYEDYEKKIKTKIEKENKKENEDSNLNEEDTLTIDDLPI
ncbi:MAG: hypothetical protein ACP5H7_00975 [Minisyncoccia bacterium]